MSDPSHTSTRNRFYRKGISYERFIRFFFASNAGLTIIILALITGFLLKEGLGFFPGYKREREIYRITGMEYVDLSRDRLTDHEQLVSLLNRAYFAEINGLAQRQLDRSTQSSALATQLDEATIAVRDQYFDVAEGDNPAPELLEKIKSRYATLLPLSSKNLPPTPALSDDERNTIITTMLTRDIENEDTPELVNTLATEYATARQKFSEPLTATRATIDSIEATSADLSTLVSEMTTQVKESKSLLENADILERDRSTLLNAAASAKTPEERARLTREADAAIAAKPDVAPALAELLATRDDHRAIHQKLRTELTTLQDKLPATYTIPEATLLASTAVKAYAIHLTELEKSPTALAAWDGSTPVTLSSTILSFITGKRWVTGGEWQDFYGILPLFTGSLMIAIVALTLAIPMGVGAAIYVNQFASPREQRIVKPIIEFIQAIPSVVLGFIGIFVLGNALRDLSELPALGWFPGFPMDERLNIFTAGCLLALMAIPTIFSLAEDAINNVPSAYSEASEALGASKLQTTFRVIIPAAFSGILAAVLLGLGRVIGETMVVLLVAGNRIKIPDFSAGIGAFFQPAHTMTGIIAQELGEVPMGSVHYRALFVVGIILFAIVLGINALSHHLSKKLRH